MLSYKEEGKNADKAERVLVSESGSFFTDDEGVAQRFEPATNNPFIDEETEVKANSAPPCADISSIYKSYKCQICEI